MSRAKKIVQIQTDNYFESTLDYIDLIRGKTLQKVSSFFARCQIKYDYLVDFLNDPIGYPGDPNKLKLVVDKFLRDNISEYYRQLQAQKLPIKLVYKIIFNQIFRGKR